MSVYGTDIHTAPLTAFLACRLQNTRARVAPDASPSDLRTCVPTSLDGHVHQAAVPSFHGPRELRRCGTGREYSPAGHRLRLWGLALGPASPCADCHGAGTLGLPVCGVLTRSCAYSFRHPHFPPLHPQVSTGASPLRERSPTPQRGLPPSEGRASAGRLIPTILGARTLDR